MSNEDNHTDKQEKELFAAFLQLKTIGEVANFCRDLMTLAEIKEFSRRWQIAKLLYENKLSYEQIAKELGTSTTTVTRVNQWLIYGQNGYQTVLKKINKTNNQKL